MQERLQGTYLMQQQCIVHGRQAATRRALRAEHCEAAIPVQPCPTLMQHLLGCTFYVWEKKLECSAKILACLAAALPSQKLQSAQH